MAKKDKKVCPVGAIASTTEKKPDHISDEAWQRYLAQGQ